MDSRSKKSRSLAIDDKSSSASQRPSLGDRHNSAPPTKARRESQSKRVSSSTKTSDSSRRGSKVSQKDDVPQRLSTGRISERSRSGSQSKLLQVRLRLAPTHLFSLTNRKSDSRTGRSRHPGFCDTRCQRCWQESLRPQRNRPAEASRFSLDL
jgi:hypothetical protein